jgi:hypothetical protein
MANAGRQFWAPDTDTECPKASLAAESDAVTSAVCDHTRSSHSSSANIAADAYLLDASDAGLGHADAMIKARRGEAARTRITTSTSRTM